MVKNTIRIFSVIHHWIPINHEWEYVPLKFFHCFAIRCPFVTIGSRSLPPNIQWKTFPRWPSVPTRQFRPLLPETFSNKSENWFGFFSWPSITYLNKKIVRVSAWWNWRWNTTYICEKWIFHRPRYKSN